MSATSTRPGAGAGWDPATVLAGLALAVGALFVGVTTAATHLALRLFGRPSPPASAPVAPVRHAAGHAAAAGHVHAHAHAVAHALRTAAQPPTGGAGARQGLPGNPVELTIGLVRGTVVRPVHLVGVGIGLAAVLLAVAVTVGTWLFGRGARRERVDAAARHLASGRELAGLHGRGAARAAARLGAVRPDGTPAGPGLPIGVTVPAGVLGRGRALVQGWEEVSVDVWGPRQGKTTCRVIPAILTAPGAVLVTSNKRDVLDVTGPLRAAPDRPVVVFDPQGVAATARACWWDPLSFVTDLTRARTLAGVFAAAAREPGSAPDAYFDPAARELVAALLLAAAGAQLPIATVHTWLTRPDAEIPVELLHAAGYPAVADTLARTSALPDRQRGGIYGTATGHLAFLTDPAITGWITPGDPDQRFDPGEWLEAAGTLYLLSREGPGSAAAVITALTVAVVDAAETKATAAPRGRLEVPMVCVLDEAANVCRWPDLPDLYSHHGSRGIVLMTILQSWAQGQGVWGEVGMRKLWSAANIRIIGPGLSDVAFLDEAARLSGQIEHPTASITHDPRGRSVSRATRTTPALDVADLAGLPKGRAWLLASGTRPALITTRPWQPTPPGPVQTGRVPRQNAPTDARTR